jgi:hypothetical protein
VFERLEIGASSYALRGARGSETLGKAVARGDERLSSREFE